MKVVSLLTSWIVIFFGLVHAQAEIIPQESPDAHENEQRVCTTVPGGKIVCASRQACGRGYELKVRTKPGIWAGNAFMCVWTGIGIPYKGCPRGYHRTARTKPGVWAGNAFVCKRDEEEVAE